MYMLRHVELLIHVKPSVLSGILEALGMSMGVGRIFPGGAARFFRNFSKVGPKVVKFVFSHS